MDCLHNLLPAWILLLICGFNNLLGQQPGANQETRDPVVVKIEALADEADKFILQGQFDKAVNCSEQAAKLDEKSVLVHVIRGRVANAQREFESAHQAFDAALALPGRGPDERDYRSRAYAGKSFACYEQGKMLEAVDNAYLGTLEKYGNTDCHLQRARAYLARQEWDKVINSANRVIGLDPKSALAYCHRGMAYASKGNHDQAIKDQTKAIELDAKMALAFQRRATAQIQKKKFAEAIKDIEQALQIQPDHAEALCDRAVMLAANRNPTQAEADLQAALRSDPFCLRAYLLKAELLVSRDRHSEALKIIDAAEKKLPHAELAIALARGFVYQEQKNYAAAVKEYTRAIELDEENPKAYQSRANCYRKLGQDEAARADFAKHKELSPEEPEKKEAKKKSKDAKPANESEKIPMFLVRSVPVSSQSLPTVKQLAAQLDKIVDAGHQRNQVTANPRTTDEQFLRRVYLDVTGAIPTYREATQFLASNDPDKRSKLIDELLNDERYASHSFNYWADVLRYKDGLSPDVRGEPFRQWIKQSFAENKPWNRMVYEMLTAEGRIFENPAAGYFLRDPGMPLDVMNNTVRIFLGTRIGCAQCHDHPFDRWTQREFYEIAAFTFGTQCNTASSNKKFWEVDPKSELTKQLNAIVQEEEDRRISKIRLDRMINFNLRIVHDEDRQLTLPKDYQYSNGKPGEKVLPKTLFGAEMESRPNETPRQTFARWVVQRDNPRFAKTIANRIWKRLFGLGQFEPVDDITDDTQAENPELMEFLEGTIRRTNFNLKEYTRVLLNSQAYQRQSSSVDVAASAKYRFPGPVLRRMTAEQAWDSFITLSVAGSEYREPPADPQVEFLKLDLANMSAEEILQYEKKAGEWEAEIRKGQTKFHYRGELLARASELPQPVPPNHFLRVFGQSDRELISASSTSGSVPQILYMFNGPVTHMLLEQNSTIYNNIVRKNAPSEGIRAAFLTILTRSPEPEEMEAALAEVKQNGLAGFGNVVWSLVNTREFLFVQ